MDRVRFSFFTAGSGGAGPTILTATFLILGMQHDSLKEIPTVYVFIRCILIDTLPICIFV